MTRSTQAWSCGSFARSNVPWCCWIEPYSVDACARMIMRSCFAASGSRCFGSSAFGWPLRSPTSICSGMFVWSFAQRQNPSSFGKNLSQVSATRGYSGKLCFCQCMAASWYLGGSWSRRSFTRAFYRGKV